MILWEAEAFSCFLLAPGSHASYYSLLHEGLHQCWQGPCALCWTGNSQTEFGQVWLWHSKCPQMFVWCVSVLSSRGRHWWGRPQPQECEPGFHSSFFWHPQLLKETQEVTYKHVNKASQNKYLACTFSMATGLMNLPEHSIESLSNSRSSRLHCCGLLEKAPSLTYW